MGKDVVTSFRVEEDLWRKARIYALENDMTVKQLLEKLLRMELNDHRIRKELAKGEK